MHGVQRVRLIVVSPLVMSHVNGDRRVEGGEEVVGGCGGRGGRGDFKKGETFQRWRISELSWNILALSNGRSGINK